MIITRNHLAIALIVLFTFSAFAQENNRTKDTINTEVVNVVKPYTPTISDAFKVKEIPSLDDEVTETRKEVKYNIFSIPVASTFTPAKATAAAVDKAEPVKLYDNYASFGVGSYTSFLGEVYLNHAINSTESVGGYVSHHSSQGGIDGVLLNDDFSDTRFNANYSRKSSDFSWNVDAGARHQIFNWYAEDFGEKENLVAFLKYYFPELENNLTIKFFEYDWSLNDASEVKKTIITYNFKLPLGYFQKEV